MYGGQKNSYKSLVSGRINTKLTIYINAYWQDLKTSTLLDAVLVNFNWMCWASWASKERRNGKLKGQLEKGRLPLLMSRTSLCLVPNTQCHFTRKKTKKTQLQNINLEDIVSSTNLYAPAIAKCLQGNLSTSDLLPVGNKQISNVNGGISFYQEEAKTFAQLLFALGSRDE